jgi:hypothetical protein
MRSLVITGSFIQKVTALREHLRQSRKLIRQLAEHVA